MAVIGDKRIEEVGHSSRPLNPPSPAVSVTGPAYRYLTAVVASQYGNWLTTVAVMVLLYRISGGGIGPAAYMLARVAPRALSPIIGGSLGDRFGPSRVVCASYILQGVCTAGIIVAAHVGSVIGVCLAVALGQAAGACASPCEAALIPSLVGYDALNRLNALRSIGNTSSMLVSPAIGAIALTVMSPEALISVDVATFAFAAAILGSLQGKSRSPKAVKRPAPLRAAARLVFGDQTLRTFAAVSFVSAAAATASSAALIDAATQRYGGSRLVGWLYAAVGVGGMVGGALALKWSPLVNSRVLSLLGVAEAGALALFPLTYSLVAGCGALVLCAVAGGVAEIWGMAEMQRRVAAGILTRVSGLLFLALFLGMLTGAVAFLAMSSFLAWDRAVLTIACASGGIAAFPAIASWKGARLSRRTPLNVLKNIDNQLRRRPAQIHPT